MELILWTNSTSLARLADKIDIASIGVDFEQIGKDERQGHHPGCWISDHDEDDLVAIGACLTRAQLFVRTNPPHPGLQEEIDRIIMLGTQTLMLPMFRTADEARHFVACIRGRAKVILQVETAAAAANIADIAKVQGVDGIFVGLNDLALDLGLRNRFSFLLTPLMQRLSDVVRGNAIPFGFGGIGRIDDATLPIPSDLIFAQYAKFHGTSALIARIFLRKDSPEQFFAEDIKNALRRLEEWKNASPEELKMATRQLEKVLNT